LLRPSRRCYERAVSHPIIDLVYTWVDGFDPKWQELKNHYMRLEGLSPDPHDQELGDDLRHRHMNEIVYAIRSAGRYAPWVRRIHVVVADGQSPPAEILAIPNVVVVPHSAFIPAEILPTFTCRTIEAFMHRIPGLSEVFIYGNDDYLFWKPTPPTYFVSDDQLHLRGYFQPPVLARVGLLRKGHMKVANRSALMLYARGFARVFMPEHCYHVLRKSTCEAVWKDLADEMGAAIAGKFRDENREFWWQMLVYAYEDKLHKPIHELSLGKVHLSFAEVTNSRLMSAYVRSRLLMLSWFPDHTVCFNTIPESWYDRMHRYFEMHLDRETPAIGDVMRLLASPGREQRRSAAAQR
jgi:hypothetical protein